MEHGAWSVEVMRQRKTKKRQRSMEHAAWSMELLELKH
jgi:hypothetical protein